MLGKRNREREENVMMNISTFWTLIFVLGCIFVTPSFARWEDQPAKTAVSIPQPPLTTDEDDGPIIDSQPGIIANPEGVELGRIKDFVLDLQTGRIAYVVGAFDHAKKFIDKLFVIPWGVVKLDPDMATFALLENKTVLDDAPSLSLYTWSDLQLAQWRATVDTYWQGKSTRLFTPVNSAETALYIASDLLGMTLKNGAGKDVGTIEQILMVPETGAIAYIILAIEHEGKTSHTSFFALPWSAVQVNRGQPHPLIVNVDKNKFMVDPDVSRGSATSSRPADAPERRGARPQKHPQ
jgi:sporulation protein YlmC with PRC-barrel domain